MSSQVVMSNYTHQTAPTQFVEANGIRFAYRRFGKTGGVPIVFKHEWVSWSVQFAELSRCYQG